MEMKYRGLMRQWAAVVFVENSAGYLHKKNKIEREDENESNERVIKFVEKRKKVELPKVGSTPNFR